MNDYSPMETETPSAVVQAIIAAGEVEQADEVFRRLLPGSIPRWRRSISSSLRHWEQSPDREIIFRQWGAENAEELEALDDEQLFARWMAATSVEGRRRVALNVHEVPSTPPVRRVIVGEVHENDDIAHVVYREIVSPGHDAVRVVTLSRTEAGWRVGIDTNLLGAHALHFGPVRRVPTT